MQRSSVLLGAALLAVFVASVQAVVVPTPPFQCSEAQCVPDCFQPKMDFLIATDVSTSMDPYIGAIATSVIAFVNKVKAAGVLARFAIVGFQGYPELHLDWTSNETIVADTLTSLSNCIRDQNGIRATGCKAGSPLATCTPIVPGVTTQTDCIANYHQFTGQEGLFDALRRALNRNCTDCTLIRDNVNPLGRLGAMTPLTFRPDADRYVMAMVDEDADMPMKVLTDPTKINTPSYRTDLTQLELSVNQYCVGGICQRNTRSGTACEAPIFPSPKVAPASYCRYTAQPEWIMETQATADALLELNVELSIFTRDQRSTYYQFGDPSIQVQSATLDNFDRDATLAALGKLRPGFTDPACHYNASIQKLMLEQGGSARVFSITSSATVIPQYFNIIAQKYEASSSDCNAFKCGDYPCSDSGGCSRVAKCTNSECTTNCKVGNECVFGGTQSGPNTCLFCQPQISNTSFTACDDLNPCTQNLCSNGACDFSQPTCPSLACGRCLIAGTCYTKGTLNSAATGRCEPEVSLTSWTPLPTSCEPITSCNALQWKCGILQTGCGATASCGACFGQTTCSNASNTCVCRPHTCATRGSTCGFPDDGCGGILNCGGCANGDSCHENKFCKSAACSPNRTCEFSDCGAYEPGPGCPTANCGLCQDFTCPTNKLCTFSCTPLATCESVGRECGNFYDGCAYARCGNNGACANSSLVCSSFLQCVLPPPPPPPDPTTGVPTIASVITTGENVDPVIITVATTTTTATTTTSTSAAATLTTGSTGTTGLSTTAVPTTGDVLPIAVVDFGAQLKPLMSILALLMTAALG